MLPSFCTIVHAVQETSTPVVGSVAPPSPSRSPGPHNTRPSAAPAHLGPGGRGGRQASAAASPSALPVPHQSKSLTLKYHAPWPGAAGRTRVVPAHGHDGAQWGGGGACFIASGAGVRPRWESISLKSSLSLKSLLSLLLFFFRDNVSP